jgi:hypothetical protein
VGAIGAALPWFRPEVNGAAVPGLVPVWSWNNGRVGLVGPALMVLSAIIWGFTLANRRLPVLGGRSPVRIATILSLVGGVFSLFGSWVAYRLVPHDYAGWNQAAQIARDKGLRLDIGTQIGFFWVVVAAVLTVVFGIIGLVKFFRPDSARPSEFGET